MEPTQKLPVTRENVFALCDEQIVSGVVPRTKDLRHFFDKPSSPKVSVYVTEWKEANPAKLNHSISYWRNLAQGLITKCDDLQLELNLVSQQLSDCQQHLNPPFAEEMVD